jgi:hypothetical protein
MYEAVRIRTWEQPFHPKRVPNAVFEAIADRAEWSYKSMQSLVPENDAESCSKFVVLAFEANALSPEEMLLVQPIDRQTARQVLVRDCGYNEDYIDHLLLSTRLYRISHDGLSLWWVSSLDYTFSQLTVGLTDTAHSQ